MLNEGKIIFQGTFEIFKETPLYLELTQSKLLDKSKTDNQNPLSISESLGNMESNEKKIIEDYVAELTRDQAFDKPIVTEIKQHTIFYKAEEYHQDFEKLNPLHPYVRQISIPRLNRFKAKSPEILKESK